MWTIFKLQWQRLFKQPVLLLLFLGLTVLFVYFMGGSQAEQKITIRTFSDELTSEQLDEWLNRLNEEDTFYFEESDYETVHDRIRMNETAFALELNEDHYRFLVGREDMEMSAIVQHVDQIYTQEKRLDAIEQNDLSERVEVETFIDINTFEGEDTVSTAQVFPIAVLVGMTFYFSIFTILLMMINLVEEKKKGTWNRLIFSPLSKTKIYMGQLLHYFLVGLVQIGLSFTILRFLVGTSLGTNYLSMLAVILSFVFAIVSLGLLIIGLVNSPQQLQVVIPIVTTSMAMIGGAFWPLDVVSNRLLLFLAELMPIKHGLQGMMGAIVQGRGITELLEPISALLLMGVLFMGVGLNLMERVSEKRSV